MSLSPRREIWIGMIVGKCQNVPMNRIMLPSSRLLDANTSPFGFRQETTLGQGLGQIFGKNNVSVEQSSNSIKLMSYVELSCPNEVEIG